MSDAIIKMTGGVIRQQKNTILKNVNLEIQNGEFIYLIGKVGSGKSSFLKTLYAELPLAYGSAQVTGFQLKNIKKSQIPLLRRKCGIVFQDFKLLIDRNVYKNLEFVLRATGWKNKKAIQERIDTVLSKVDMLEKKHQMPHQLSGGEQQRIVLARALLNAPPLILADEPTGNIDPETSYQLIELLKELSDTGKTVIIATHQYDLIEKYPGRVFCCENGELSEQKKIIPTIDIPKEQVATEEKTKEKEITVEEKQELKTIEKKEISVSEKNTHIKNKPSSLLDQLDYPEISAFDYELKESTNVSIENPDPQKLEEPAPLDKKGNWPESPLHKGNKNPADSPLIMDLELID